MKKQKRVLVYFGHPAQFLFLRPSIHKLQDKGVEFKILIKSKDVLEDLLQEEGLEYTNILKRARGNSKVQIAFSLLVRLIRITPIILSFRPQLMLSTDASLMILGRLFGIHRLVITDDDYDIVKNNAKLSYPNSNFIVCPSPTRVGEFSSKKIGYEGYMKLAYLHPNIFEPNKNILERYNIEKNFALLRLAKLTAFHDEGIDGLDFKIIEKIIKVLQSKGIQTYISSEVELPQQFEPYRLVINPKDIHHILNFSKLLICDSQSMSGEACILGVPSIRYSSFSGKISVLEELEHKYQLTFGVPIGDFEGLLKKVDQILSDISVNNTFNKRKEKLLADKIDVTQFMSWLISEYPKSVNEFKQNPSVQYNFK